MPTTRKSVILVLAAVTLVGCSKSTQDPPPAAEETTAEMPDSTAAEMVESSADTTELTSPTETQQGTEMTQQTNYFEITTPLGNMVLRLYDETPIHRDNFRKLVSDGFYNGTTFHRVIEGFMIQGGDVLSKDDDPMNDGTGDPGYTLEAEFRKNLFHKRGALAAARQGDQVNPQRRSSGSQFYIVQGTVHTPDGLAEMERQMKTQAPDFELTDASRAAYASDGGAPFLDGQYTVFGELVDGFDVLDAIAGTNTPRKRGERVSPALVDRPAEPIRMEVRPLPDYPS